MSKLDDFSLIKFLSQNFHDYFIYYQSIFFIVLTIVIFIVFRVILRVFFSKYNSKKIKNKNTILIESLEKPIYAFTWVALLTLVIIFINPLS